MLVLSVLFFLFSPLALAFVWNPHILVPNETTRWTAGQTYTVQWNTTVAGQEIPNGVKGIIMLGYLEGNSIDEHLYWELVRGFPLNQGHQNVTLPADLVTKDSYIIVLMGDSGNASPKFTITAAQSQ